MKLKTLFLITVVLIFQVACTPRHQFRDTSDWLDLAFTIDGSTELEFKVPRSSNQEAPPNLLFVVTEGGSPIQIFSALYDPGSGRDRSLYLTLLSAVVLRLESPTDEQHAISLNDIKNEVYLSRPGAGTKIQVIGESVFAGRPWLRINLRSSLVGVSYATPIDKNLVLVLKMSAFGENTFGSRLFEKRIETLEAMVESVTFSNMDH